MDYFKQPIRPDLRPDHHSSTSPEADDPNLDPDLDPDEDFLADADFGETSRSSLRARLRIPRASRAPGAPFSSRAPSLSRPPLHRRLGLDNKSLTAVAVAIALVTGTVTAFALSGGDRTVTDGLPPASTVTTFPAFPTASVMPPANADEEPDGGVIVAPDLPTGEEGDTDSGADAASAPPEEDPTTEQPDAPASSPAARQRTAGTATAPVQGYVITAAYAQSGNWSTGHHTGVDLAVPVGTPVVAVRPGMVLMSATDASYGNYVLIKHAEHEYTLYAHLSQLGVKQGAVVSDGQRIGFSGATGNVTGPHLHFEARTEPVFGSDVDPVAYLAAHGVRL
ncbi:M23 family metallopeptidase [Streptomyces sp. NBC_01261]|uniref:M23 family metallopeptidase n=1 Tax=Streptomyces sp. NBC_01261 TaxID=2903802 RepID=UPI002E30D988|nr:M23 family metallopeptidase [Streptomyces sp. NBC_01261]